MLQDIFPHVFHNAYKTDVFPQNEDTVFCFSGSKVLMREEKTEDPKDMFPRKKDIWKGCNFIYLFRIDEENFFYLDLPPMIPKGFSFQDVNILRRERIVPQYLSFAVMTAKHLSDWYHDSQFCGRCGSPMAHSEQERAMECISCKNTVYPRIMPAVIVGVINGDKLLLTKYRTGFRHNALIAGFTEIGETAEETVSREVMEEAGIRVRNIRYYKSQPWGIANDLLLGYFCEVEGDTEIHMDMSELKYAEWVSRDKIELQPDSFSLTGEMMRMFKEGKVF